MIEIRAYACGQVGSAGTSFSPVDPISLWIEKDWVDIWTGGRAVKWPGMSYAQMMPHSVDSNAAGARQSAKPPMGRGLSARILGIAVLCLLVGEVLIFVPSIARFWQSYLKTRVAAAHLAVLAPSQLGTKPDMELADALLLHSGTLAIIVRDPQPNLMLGETPMVDKTYWLSRNSPFELIFNAFETLYFQGGRVIRVVDDAPMESGVEIEIVLAEGHLWTEMTAYAKRILWLSLVLSAIVASLLFWRLQRLIVKPLAGIAAQLTAFRRHPEDASIEPPLSGRSDEIGLVEYEMHEMQHDLRQALGHKVRLAALGEAVSKINHDLRNILSSALLVPTGLSAVRTRRCAPPRRDWCGLWSGPHVCAKQRLNMRGDGLCIAPSSAAASGSC